MSSTRSAPVVELALGRSRLRQALAAAGHAAAAAALLSSSLSWWLQLGGAGVLAASLVREWRRDWPVRLVTDGRSWLLCLASGRVLRGRGLHVRRQLSFVTSVAFGVHRDTRFALYADMFCDGGHARLRRLLRHGPRTAPC